MSNKTLLLPRLYFSYSQFFVRDAGVDAPGCIWTDEHIAQGFARRDSAVSFSTLLEFGYADVLYCCGQFRPSDEYQRVVAVPFHVCSGKVVVDGPDELNVDRAFELPPANYRIVAAQRVVSDDEEAIDLFIEALSEPLANSEVIVADELLNPPIHLVETADVA